MQKNHQSKYWFLLCIQTLAGFASWIDIFLIFSVASFIWKSSPSEVALVAALYGLPSLIIGPIFGAFLDRSDPRKLMLLGTIFRTFFTVLIAVAPSFWIFAILVLAKGLANLAYWPSSAVITNQVIHQNVRTRYFSSLSALDQLAKIATPALAGLLILAVPAQRVFFVSAASTGICVLVLPRLFKGIDFPIKENIRGVRNLAMNLIDGFKSFSSLPPALLISMCLTIGASLALAIYDPHLASFVRSKGFDTTVFSLIVSSTAAGAITAAFLVRFLLKNKEAGFLIRHGIVIFSLAIVSSAVIIKVAPYHLNNLSFAALWFTNGFGYELFTIGASVNIQNLCPQHLLGRVSTSLRSVSTFAIVSAPSLGALLIAHGGTEIPFIAAAAISVMLLALVFMSNRWNRPFFRY